MEIHDFLDDEEKMIDFEILPKEEFLFSYSYLTEEEYNLTSERMNNKNEKPKERGKNAI